MRLTIGRGASMSDSRMQRAVLELMEWAYGKAIDGLPALASADKLAEDYLKQDGTLQENVNSLIRWQNAKAGTSGFITGLGGWVTLPVAVPANVSVVLLLQIRMIAAIAIMGGHDVNDDRVKTLVYLCLVGNAGKQILKRMGIDLTTRLACSAIQSIPGKALTAINQAVGFRLVTKFGEKGMINMGKAVPLVGGVVGATFEVVSTNAIGKVAREIFCEEGESVREGVAGAAFSVTGSSSPSRRQRQRLSPQRGFPQHSLGRNSRDSGKRH